MGDDINAENKPEPMISKSIRIEKAWVKLVKECIPEEPDLEKRNFSGMNRLIIKRYLYSKGKLPIKKNS
jgi:hypothetical protein